MLKSGIYSSRFIIRFFFIMVWFATLLPFNTCTVSTMVVITLAMKSFTNKLDEEEIKTAHDLDP